MEKILNKCPICGAGLEYSALQQYSNIFKVLKDGTLSKNRIRKEDNGSMECGYLSCTNDNCNFVTDCDLKVMDNPSIKIYQQGYRFLYKTEEE